MNKDNNFLSEAMNRTLTMDALDFLEKLPRDCVDLIVTSPPYNPAKNTKHPTTHENFSYWLDILARRISNVLAPGGVVAMVLGGTRRDNQSIVPMDWIVGWALESYQIHHINRIIWPGRHPSPSVGRLALSYETILIHAYGTPRTFNPGQGQAKYDDWSDVERIVPGHRERTSHRDQFSEALVERLCKTYSVEGDLVLDCFSGSGTTQKVCRAMKRRFIGCDTAHEPLRNKRLVEESA